MSKLSEEILHVVVLEQKKQKVDTNALAQKAGCTVRAIDYWKRGKRNISLNMAIKVLGVLGYELRIYKREGEENAL